MNTPLSRSQPINSTAESCWRKQAQAKEEEVFTWSLQSLPVGWVFFGKPRFCSEPWISLPVALTSHSDEMFYMIQGPPHTLLKEPHLSQMSLHWLRMERWAGAPWQGGSSKGQGTDALSQGALAKCGGTCRPLPDIVIQNHQPGRRFERAEIIFQKAETLFNLNSKNKRREQDLEQTNIFK